MAVKKGDFVTVEIDGKVEAGIITGSQMGQHNLMTQKGELEIMENEVRENKGNVFEKFEE